MIAVKPIPTMNHVKSNILILVGGPHNGDTLDQGPDVAPELQQHDERGTPQYYVRSGLSYGGYDVYMHKPMLLKIMQEELKRGLHVG